MSPASFISKLKNGVLTRPEAIEIVNLIGGFMASVEGIPKARRLSLACLEHVEKFPSDMRPIICDLLAELGYYPYLAGFDRGFKHEMKYEFFRSSELPSVVLHRDQFVVSEALKRDGGVILTAPTSFGKSLLIEEVIASKRFTNIVVVEPTLALIDELRRKLRKYSDYYKLIFAKAQSLGDRNVFLLTQERLVEFEGLPKIDFFVIDEFYKLSTESDDRANVLNHAFYLLLKQTGNFYLLGPPVESIPSEFLLRPNCKYIDSHIETVTIDHFRAGKRKFKALSELLVQFDDPTLVYCRGPGWAESLARTFAENLTETAETNEHANAIDWAKINVHKDWTLLSCLRKRVAFHHGGLPRHFSKYIIESFNEGKIRYLFCTTTLIEGVNTSAKNVVIYDHKKGNDPLTRFDIRNISGRAGRMGRYLSGNVFSFEGEADSRPMNVDFPCLTQINASDELLVQIEEPDLKPLARERVQKIKENGQVSIDVIRENSNVHPYGQVELAKELRRSGNVYHAMLCWSAYPTGPQLKIACDLIWQFLVPKRNGRKMVDGILSGKQLAFIINRYRRAKSPKTIIHKMVEDGEGADKAVRECTHQVRHWFEFRFPKLLMALDKIQGNVFREMGLPPGDYSFFAGQLENGFVPRGLAALRELGVPHELARKLEKIIPAEAHDDIDSVLRELRRLAKSDALHPYEQEIVRRL